MKLSTLVRMSIVACAVAGVAVSAVSAAGTATDARGTRGAGRAAAANATGNRGAARGAGITSAATPGRAGRAGRAGAAAGTAVKPSASATRPAPGERVDQREANQQKRIDEGIKKGQLTPDETSTLETQEKNIQTMEDAFKSDGALTKDEAKQLREALNQASLQIWAQRHDTEGNQKPVSRLGKDIFAQDSLTSKIESGDLTKADARAFLKDFHEMVYIKRMLATGNLTDEQRAKLQAQYNELLNQYFLTK